MDLHSVVNNHWLVSWPSIMTTQPLALLIPIAFTVCGLIFTIINTKYRNDTVKNEDRKSLFPFLFYPNFVN